MPETLPAVLVPPAEPLDLKAALREEAGRAPEETRRALAGGQRVGDYLWGAWASELPAGASRSDVVGYAGTSWREVWLWVMGERTWQEAATLVGGGVLRRIRS
ncbi:MAG TPA: hypothetical protein VFA11_17440 [Acidimicrobiales bacterium]|nr:hypothetical protein [Acidimicrobiales bacterium]